MILKILALIWFVSLTHSQIVQSHRMISNWIGFDGKLFFFRKSKLWKSAQISLEIAHKHLFNDVIELIQLKRIHFFWLPSPGKHCFVHNDSSYFAFAWVQTTHHFWDSIIFTPKDLAFVFKLRKYLYST